MANHVVHSDELPYDTSTSGLISTNVQDAIDEVAAATGGAPWRDRVIPASGPGGASDDEFNDDTVAGAWSTVATTGTVTVTEAGDVLSLKLVGQSSGDIAGVLKAIPGTPAAPITVEAALRTLTGASGAVFTGLVMASGTAPSSSAIFVGLIASGPIRLAFREGTLTSLTTETSALSIPYPDGGFVLPWLHLRLKWASTNTFEIEASPDGVSWLTFASRTFTLAPTHFGIMGSSWGTGTQILSAEYFRVS